MACRRYGPRPCTTVSTQLLLSSPPHYTCCSRRETEGQATGSATQKTTPEIASYEPSAGVTQPSAFNPLRATYPPPLSPHHSGVSVKRGCSEGRSPSGRSNALGRALQAAEGVGARAGVSAAAGHEVSVATQRSSRKASSVLSTEVDAARRLLKQDHPAVAVQRLENPAPNESTGARAHLCKV